MNKKKVITINGKGYPCRVTMGALLRFKHESGHDVSDLKTNDLSDLALFMWCCTSSACNADGVEFGMSFDQFADSLEPSGLQDFYSDMQTDEKKTAQKA